MERAKCDNRENTATNSTLRCYSLEQMNFYGTTIGPQHTLFGRVLPMMEAMRLAISRASGQPLPAVESKGYLPEWCHNIADELTTTVFKGIVNFAPRGGKYHARHCGQMVGFIIRAAFFYWRDVPAKLERDGLNKLTPKQEQKLETVAGWDVAMSHASKQAGRPIKTKAQLFKFWGVRTRQFGLRVIRHTWNLAKFAFQQPLEDVLQFLSGIPEGFKCFLRTDGEFAKTGKRTEVFFVLMMYWPEIEEMRQAQPPVTRKFLLDWLEKEEGKQLVESDQIFFGICGDIGLDMAPPGHPFKRDQGQL